MVKKRMLIVDDEVVNRQILQELFAPEFEVSETSNGEDALAQMAAFNPDIILLDVIMPKMDGFQTCLRIRQKPEWAKVPVIFLTSRAEPQSESFGLELGADDYVIKPFNREVLKARVKKRLNQATPAPLNVTRFESYEVMWDRQEISHGSETIPLTGKESRLLQMLVENTGRVLTRTEILERIWADTYITDRTIDSHIKELRRKLPPLAQRIKTVYGTGYRLDE